MKNAKKLLSLVLVLVLAMSLIPFASAKPAAKNADDYPDYESFSAEYIEAIDVLTALGVLVGDEFGTFGADKTFTRGQAAKVITYLMIGTAAADRLGPTLNTPRFTDVGRDHWANPFVEYCAANDVIVGYGDGTFHPEAPVTAAQLSKMLLIAIGYGAQDEYVGERWQHNAIVDGQNKKILDTGVDYTAPALREEMARYVFNALTKPWVVTYNPALFGYYDGSQIWGTDSERQTLGQKTFKLYDRYSVDNLGYGVREWKLGSQFNANSITYTYKADTVLKAEGAKYTSTNGTVVTGVDSLTRIYSKNFCGYELIAYKDENGVDVPIEYYINGTNLAGLIEENATGGTFRYTNYFTGAVGTSMTYAAAMDAAIASINAAADKTGVIVDLIDRNEDGNADKVIVIVKTGAAIGAAPLVSDTAGTVRIVGLQNGEATPSGNIIGYRNFEAGNLAGTPTFEKGTIEYEGFKAGDIVLYYIDGFGRYHIEKPESVTNKLTDYYTATKLAQFGDNRYSETGLSLLDSILIEWRYQPFVGGDPYNYDRETVAYLDDNGSIFAFVLLSIPSPDYLVLLNAAPNGFHLDGNVILMDGKEYNDIEIASIKAANGDTLDMLVPDAANPAILRANIAIPSNGQDKALNTKAGTNAFHVANVSDTNGSKRVLSALTDRAIYAYTIDDKGFYHLTKPYFDTNGGTAGQDALTNMGTTQLDNRSIAATLQGNTTTGTIVKAPNFFSGTNYTAANTGTAARLGTSLVADDDTVFIIRDTTGKITSYVGYKSLPDFDTATYFGFGEAVSFAPYPAGSALTIAKMVFLDGATLSSTSDEQLMFVNLAGYKKTGGDGFYYALAIGEDGTLKEVKIATALFDTYMPAGSGPTTPVSSYYQPALVDAVKDYPSVLYNVTYNSKGIISAIVKPDNIYMNTATTATNSAYGFGLNSYTVQGGKHIIRLSTEAAGGAVNYDYGFNPSTIKVYVIETNSYQVYDPGDLVLSDLNELGYDKDAMWFAKLDSKSRSQITELFIVRRNVGSAPVTPGTTNLKDILPLNQTVEVVATRAAVTNARAVFYNSLLETLSYWDGSKIVDVDMTGDVKALLAALQSGDVFSINANGAFSYFKTAASRNLPLTTAITAPTLEIAATTAIATGSSVNGLAVTGGTLSSAGVTVNGDVAVSGAGVWTAANFTIGGTGRTISIAGTGSSVLTGLADSNNVAALTINTTGTVTIAGVTFTGTTITLTQGTLSNGAVRTGVKIGTAGTVDLAATATSITTNASSQITAVADGTAGNVTLKTGTITLAGTITGNMLTAFAVDGAQGVLVAAGPTTTHTTQFDLADSTGATTASAVQGGVTIANTTWAMTLTVPSAGTTGTYTLTLGNASNAAVGTVTAADNTTTAFGTITITKN